MRAALTIAALTLMIGFMASAARSDQPPAEQADPIPWREPFEAISASKADDALVLMVFTDEDPFLVRAAVESGQDAEENQAVNRDPPIWCASVLKMAYRRALRQRPELRNRLTLQSITAGLPRELTGGQPRKTPSRAMVALCDGDYRLLALTVGVPDGNELMTLIEDGEEVATTRQLHGDDPPGALEAITERSNRRLSRLWRAALKETLDSMRVELQQSAVGDAPFHPGFIRSVGESFEPTYIADVRLRFGLSEAADRTRLVILEHHPEARRPWCEAMLPFTAGLEMSQAWRELVEAVWGHQPITADADAENLLAWYDLQHDSELMVLSVRSSLRAGRDPWPPITDKFARRGVSWREAHALALQRPFREVDPQQLATLIHARRLKAVDIVQPSTLRYLLFDPRKDTPLAIRESDSPGRFAGILKRSGSNHARP